MKDYSNSFKSWRLALTIMEAFILPPLVAVLTGLVLVPVLHWIIPTSTVSWISAFKFIREDYFVLFAFTLLSIALYILPHHRNRYTLSAGVLHIEEYSLLGKIMDLDIPVRYIQGVRLIRSMPLFPWKTRIELEVESEKLMINAIDHKKELLAEIQQQISEGV